MICAACASVASTLPMSASLTVLSDVLPLTDPSVAEIVVESSAVPPAVARPFEPAALLIVAAAVLVEPHVTCVVRFWFVASVYVPVAVNCLVPVLRTVALLGVTAIETSCAAVTSSDVCPVTEPNVAEIVVAPMPVAVARPFEPGALLIVARAVTLDAQVTCVVMSWFVASV